MEHLRKKNKINTNDCYIITDQGKNFNTPEYYLGNKRGKEHHKGHRILPIRGSKRRR